MIPLLIVLVNFHQEKNGNTFKLLGQLEQGNIYTAPKLACLLFILKTNRFAQKTLIKLILESVARIFSKLTYGPTLVSLLKDTIHICKKQQSY